MKIINADVLALVAELQKSDVQRQILPRESSLHPTECPSFKTHVLSTILLPCDTVEI